MGRWLDMLRDIQDTYDNSDNSDNSPTSNPVVANVTNVSACLICGQPADDSNSNMVHDDPNYRRVHWSAPDQWSSCSERVRTVSGYVDLAGSGKIVAGAGGL